MQFLYFFQILSINLKNITYFTFSLQFFMKTSLNCEVSSTHLKLYVGSICIITQSYKLFTSQYLRYGNSLFFSQSFRCLLLAFSYWWIELHIPPLMPFSTIKNIQRSVKRFNFTWVFFKAAKPGGEINFAGSNLQIPKRIFLKFSKTSPKSNISLLRYKS